MNRSVLKAIYDKTSGHCWYCGRSIHPLGDWQIEHQQPRCSGGDDTIENLVPACRECNAAKGRRNVEEYRHALKVKLESAITQAYEMAGDIEALVGWDSSDGFTVPPGWLCEIMYLLHDAATKTVDAPVLFYAERLTRDNDVPVEIQETEVIS